MRKVNKSYIKPSKLIKLSWEA